MLRDSTVKGLFTFCFVNSKRKINALKHETDFFCESVEIFFETDSISVAEEILVRVKYLISLSG